MGDHPKEHGQSPKDQAKSEHTANDDIQLGMSSKNMTKQSEIQIIVL